MTEISIIEKIANLYQVALTEIFQHIHSLLSNTVGIFLIPALTLYFLIIGYKTIIGDFESSKKNMIRIFLFFPFIIFIAFSYGNYLTIVVQPLIALKDFLVNGVISFSTQTKDANTFKLLDTTIVNLYSFCTNELMSGNIFSNAWGYLEGAFILIIYVYLYANIAYFMMKSLIASSLFFVIGPIALFFFGFDQTKHITGNWFKTLITYLLYAPITAFFMILTYWITVSTASNLEKSFETLLLLIISGLVLIMKIKDIPEYANALTMGMTSGGDASGMATNQGFMWGKMGASGGKGAFDYGKGVYGRARAKLGG